MKILHSGEPPGSTHLHKVSVAAGEPRRADVYDRSGELVYEMEWPADVRLMLGQMDSETAFGVSRDSLGVERVVGLRFHR